MYVSFFVSICNITARINVHIVDNVEFQNLISQYQIFLLLAYNILYMHVYKLNKNLNACLTK